ncbi:hypothetical protein ACOMHN_002630 [Nucella lapillus]
MPRNPDLPVLKCDFCPLATRNQFIFKRHRKRCLRENGGASQRSGAENLEEEMSINEGDMSMEGTEESSIVSEKRAGSQEAGSSREGDDISQGKATTGENNNPKEPVEEEMISTPSSKPPSENRITLRLRKRSISDLETSGEQSGTRTYTTKPDLEGGEQEFEICQKDTDDTSKSSGNATNLPPPNVCRNYRCGHCSFFTNKSRDFLWHKIDQHNARLEIYTCTFCEYASQYKHKLLRHMGHLHSIHLKTTEVAPEYSPLAAGGSGVQRKKPMIVKIRRGQRVVSSKVGPQSGQSLDSQLVKLREKQKVTEANLSSFFTSTSGQSTEEAEGELYKCKLCLFTANSKSKVIRHLHACHINARLFRCNLCSYKTYSKIEFYAHKKKHTSKNTTMFKCTECAYASEFRPNFDRHMLQHGCHKPHKCSLCSYATDHEGALKRHVTSHHPNTEENQSLVIAGDDHDGMLSAKPGPGVDDGGEGCAQSRPEGGLEGDGFRCPICSSMYRRLADLNRHMKSKHSISRKAFIEHNAEDDDEEVLDIDDDDEEEDNMDDNGSGENMDEEDLSEDLEESQPLTKLKDCDDRTASKKCPHCSFVAKGPSELKRHMRLHTVVKRFKCSLCSKKYKYLGDFNVHMRRDHEIDPEEEHVTPQKVSIIATKKNSPRMFRCPACPFFTKVKVQMDRHSQEHTEEKTYSCKLCDYQTYWRGDMGRHLYRRHPTEVTSEADVKEFFIFRPDRRALTKGARGAESHEGCPEAEAKMAVVGLCDCILIAAFEAGKPFAADDAEEDLAPEPSEGKMEMAEAEVEGKSEARAEAAGLPEPISNCTESVDKAGNKVYMCQLCSFANSHYHRMKNHMDTHLNLKQFKCPVCFRRSNWKYDMRKHISSRHPSCKQDVMVLTIDEAKATIQEYMASISSDKREVEALTPIKTKMTKPVSPQKASGPEAREKAEPSRKSSLPDSRKKRAYEYKCSHCQYRSWYRSSVSKHQSDTHPGQIGLGILAKHILVTPGEEREDQQCEPGSLPSEQADAQEMKEEEKMEVEEEEPITDSPARYCCAECGKEGTSKGSIKKHYNYIHPNKEVRIISVADGVEFNYYTGLPSAERMSLPAPVADAKPPVQNQPSLSSILNNPKKHGYVRPFKCSVCGQRSNWKWDIKKHLRAKHPGQFGHVVVLQLDQARATCPQKRGSAAEESDESEKNGSPTLDLDLSPKKMPATSPSMTYKHQEMMLGRYKRYKCSGCGYRSNWRTDICRHIERRHRDGKAEVIFMGVEEARQTFESYSYQPANAPHGYSNDGPRFKPPKPPSPSKSSKKQSLVTGRVWHCSKCKFVSAVRTHVVSHMQEHGMKPFRCIECGLMSRFRSPMNRHIRKQHSSTDYKAYCKLIIKYAKPALDSSAATPGRFVDAYLCRLCTGNTVETSTRENMMKHVLSEHGSTDASQALKIKKKVGMENGSDGDGYAGEDAWTKGGRPKRYFCTICPYRTDKRGMLTFHHSYHQPSGQNRYKCKLCPYYVCAPRLLHQHMKCHDEFSEDQTTLESFGWKLSMEKTPPSSPSKAGKVSFENSPKRHVCEKCPYTTNSKNDFLYHKQFHRPKPAAEYKCEYCDYWVTHRRLLRQHARLHGDEFPEDSLASSPSKSLASDASAVLDAVEIAAIKQKMIANKVTASLSTFPAVSPMKMATQCSVGNRPGYVRRDGGYRKLHQCSRCPYTNIRSRNVRLHELMHGWRRSDHPLMKCPHCDYLVGAKGLLSHHMKVHNQQYRPDPLDSTTFDLESREQAPGLSSISAEMDDEASSVFVSPDIPQRQKVDTLLEISRFKKYSCEKCPYASGKRSHFMRHMELHGSRQRFVCQYCDYAVPSMNLLHQHQRIHLMPNQNLLASQSFSNLQHLKEVPADVALASALPPTDSSESVTINVIHDHLELYENDDNNAFDATPKKLYRCDRCPYANVRRDHLLTHLRFHLAKSHFHCPYCDYSAPKQQLLTQHIRVHFCPLPELSEWLIENGQSERAQEVNDIDITKALEVAEKFQSSPKRKLNSLQQTDKKDGKAAKDDENSKGPTKKQKPDAGEKSSGKEGKQTPPPPDTNTDTQGSVEPQPSTSAAADASEKAAEEKAADDSNVYICQYCDREFPTSKLLVAHEMQHLIGNHFEVSL